jgi:hypothetical protein
MAEEAVIVESVLLRSFSSSFSWSTVGGLWTDPLYFLPAAHELLTKRCDADDGKFWQWDSAA